MINNQTETYRFLDSLNAAPLLDTFTGADIPFYKLLNLDELELRNIGVSPFELRRRIIIASQQCRAKYDFDPPYYPEQEFKKTLSMSRFFREPHLDNNIPISDAINRGPSMSSP